MGMNSAMMDQGVLQNSFQRRTVAVGPEREFQARRRLFELFGELYPVDFVNWTPAFTGCDGVILWEASSAELAAVAAQGLQCLAVPKADEPVIPVKKGAVEFGKTPLLDVCFRGQTMIEEGIGEFPPVTLQKDDELVCSLEARPYWLIRRIGSAPISVIALGPVEIPEKSTVYDHFNRRFWLQLLPFLHFLKQLTHNSGWSPPPLRACLMFDDPNLHWGSYGFIDFKQLVRHAKESNYHASFAMVPLDAWFVHSGAATLLRENRAHLSLLMHGNNHTHAEFGSPLEADVYTRMLAQGIRRIDSFERRSGVCVARVMAPPYGAFRERVADVMLNLGYEAACVSRASLKGWNKEKGWPPAFGFAVSEFFGAGFPMIPRHVMARGHGGSYRLAAFLNQPIIPHGHHQDCAGGMDLLAQVAGEINGLGEVVWTDMTSISRSNYLTRRIGSTLVVKMLARRIALPLDEGVQEIVVERPWMAQDGVPESLICQQGDRIHFAGQTRRLSPAMALGSTGTVELVSPARNPIDPLATKSPGLKIWTVARRVLSETRDRMVPLTARIRRGSRGISQS
jgi:hypothetical protein